MACSAPGHYLNQCWLSLLTHVYWTNVKRTPISKVNLIKSENCPKKLFCMVKSTMYRELSFAKQKFIVAFCSAQQTVKCSKVNKCCDKPCAHALICISVAWMGSDGQFFPVGCHPKPPGLPGITTPWCLEIGHVTLSGNQWSPLPMLNGVPDGEFAGQGSVWTTIDLWKSCVRQIEKGKALCRNPVEPCSTPLPIEDGASIRSSGTQC